MGLLSRSFIAFAVPVAFSLGCGCLAAQEATAATMKGYTVTVAGTKVEIPMQAIPVGTDGYPGEVLLGSPPDEAGRGEDEGPQVRVRIEPFWIGTYEVTWDTFNEFRRDYQRLQEGAVTSNEDVDTWADAVSLPTPLYEQEAAPILAGMGTEGGYPVANITHLAARQFTKWLSRKTGHFYRLPTEAEWEYAARAGSTGPWSCDESEFAEHAWSFDNSLYDDPDRGHPDFGAGYRKVGTRAANAWGLHDMHGNVAEWVLDQYRADAYAALAAAAKAGDGSVHWRDAIAWPERVFPCVARGGGWESEASGCRSAARLASSPQWQARDPQLPRSIWWFTDGFHVGFRILRPLAVPDRAEQLRCWEPVDELTQGILQEGGRQVRAMVPGGDGGEGGKR